jgi:hypothetical protein
MDVTYYGVTHARVATNKTLAALARRLVRCCLAVGMLAAAPAALLAQVDVLTNRYDGARSGANLNEATLTTANVNVDKFGKLYSYPVDGAVYAEPLYVSGVVVNGARRNVLYVATMNDKAYAFDADSASTAPLWMTDFTNPAQKVTAVPILDIASGGNIWGNVGIESTPVIDRAAETIYLVARTKENGAYLQRLHALDITTGLERDGSPVTIIGSVAGTALDSSVGPGGQVITFNPKLEQQRAALALSNGVVLVSWCGHEDKPPYHGWIMGFDATTLARVGIFAVTPDVYGGGVWQGGRAPTLDKDGNAYFATGNSVWDGTRNFGDSLLKFGVSRAGLTLPGYFTPSNEHILNVNDDDLSGSGFTLLPASEPGLKLLLGGGKEGVLYLLDGDNLGGKDDVNPVDGQVLQKIPVNGGHIMGGPVFWNSAIAGMLVYNWSEDDVLVAYQVSNDRLITPAYLQGAVRSPEHPGGSLTVSANGSASGTGIVWASIPTIRADAKHKLTAGILRAFHADTLQEIWTSDLNAERDRVGTLIKFVPPLVVNGKVYMATHDNAVAVYGLLPPDFSVSVAPAKAQIAPAGSGTLSVGIRAQGPFGAPVALSASGAPAGVTVSFSPSSVIGGGTATMTVALGPSASASPFTLTVAATSGSLVHAVPVVINGTPDPAEILLFAKDVQTAVGNWRAVPDSTAAYSTRIENPDAGTPKVGTPQANPVNYFELTFTAEAKVPYHLWLRAKAQNDSYNNDSVYVQFSGSVTDAGVAVNRIGSSTAATVILEDCTSCGVAGWGWQDNGYGAGVLGPHMYFTGGPQTIRIQQREDGISIDQIVLSPANYLKTSPGKLKNDDTILSPPPPPPPPPPPTSGTIVRHTASVTPEQIHGKWRLVANDPTAAENTRIELPDAGAAKIPTPLTNPDNYFELTFTAEANKPYRLWLRGRAQADSYNNDSVYVQFSGSVTGTGAMAYRIGTTDAVPVVLEDCSNCGVAGWGWQDNGYGAGVLGPVLYFSAGLQTMRIQQREDGISLDQIVLSPDTYLNSAPGATKNDTTTLDKTP